VTINLHVASCLRWLSLISLGCLLGSSVVSAQSETKESQPDEATKRAELANFSEIYSGRVVQALNGPAYGALNNEKKRNLLGWAYRSVPYVRSFPYEPNPSIAMVDLVIMTSRLNNYMQTEAAASYYGDGVSLIREISRHANEDAWGMVAQYLNPDEYYNFFLEVEQWVEKHPMTGFIGRETAVVLATNRRLANSLNEVAPSFFLGDLGSTIQSASVQMERLNLEMDHLSDQVEWMPVYIYWLSSMFALDDYDKGSLSQVIGNLSAVNSMLAPLGTLGGDLQRMTASVEQLGTLQTSLLALANDAETLRLQVEPALQSIIALEGQAGQMTDDFELLNLEAKAIRTTLEKQYVELASAAESLHTLAAFVKAPEALIWLLLKAAVTAMVAFFVCLLIYKGLSGRMTK